MHYILSDTFELVSADSSDWTLDNTSRVDFNGYNYTFSRMGKAIRIHINASVPEQVVGKTLLLDAIYILDENTINSTMTTHVRYYPKSSTDIAKLAKTGTQTTIKY
jgi:hypothetical protein